MPAKPVSRQCIDTLGDPTVVLGIIAGAIMNEMGTFRITVELENPERPGSRRAVTGVLVDTGAEMSWFPADVLESLDIQRYERWRFRHATGVVVERWIGIALVHANGKRAP